MWTLCFKQEDGWRNALANVQLLPGSVGEYNETWDLPDGDGFAIVQRVEEITRFAAFMDGLQSGRIQVGGDLVLLDSPMPETKELAPYRYSFEVVERKWAGQRPWVSTDYLTYSLEGRGRAVSEFSTQEGCARISSTLVAHTSPFDGVRDLARTMFHCTYDYFLHGFQTRIGGREDSYARRRIIEVVDGGKALVDIRGPPGSSPHDFCLNSIRRPLQGRPWRESHRFAREDVTSDTGYLRMRTPVRIEDTALLELFLVYKNDPVDEERRVLSVRDSPNPRYTAHTIYDEEAAKLRERDSFEIGVTWLLHLCGFVTAPYGLRGGKLNDVSDVLAQIPYSKRMMLVECTTGELKPEKLMILSTRCERLRTALPGFEIMPVAITTRAPVKEPEERTAYPLGIATLVRPEIEDLLAMAQANESASKVFGYILKKIRSGL